MRFFFFTWSTLINGYIENRKLNEGRFVFWWDEWEICGFLDSNDKRVCVIWRVMKALKLFKLILNSSSHPNHFTFSTVLDACAGYSAVLVGNQVHACILKSGFPLDVVLLTSLVDMYAKCGDTEVAFCNFWVNPYKEFDHWRLCKTWACRECNAGVWEDAEEWYQVWEHC